MHPHQRWLSASGANDAHGGMKTKTSPGAPAAGLKRINLAGIATTAPTAKAAKIYPELQYPDGQVTALVEGIVETSDKVVPVAARVKTKLGRGGTGEE